MKIREYPLVLTIAGCCLAPSVGADGTAQSQPAQTRPAQTQPAQTQPAPAPRTTVRAYVQTRPGGPREEVDMGVHAVPTDLPARSAAEAGLADDELVLGVVAGGKAIAYPIRYLAMYEVVNDRSTGTPLAPTW